VNFFVTEMYEHYSTIVPRIMEGDMDMLDTAIHEHKTGERRFCSLKSR